MLILKVMTMPTLRTPDHQILNIELYRDECKLIDSRSGDSEKLKKAFQKLHCIIKKMPLSPTDLMQDLQSTRESRGVV